MFIVDEVNLLVPSHCFGVAAQGQNMANIEGVACRRQNGRPMSFEVVFLRQRLSVSASEMQDRNRMKQIER